MLHRQLVHHPIAHARQGFGVNRPTGCTDGRQCPPSPLLRTTRLLRAREETRRCTDERQVAGLPCAALHLTVVGERKARYLTARLLTLPV
jgi:hypothetical protein